MLSDTFHHWPSLHFSFDLLPKIQEYIKKRESSCSDCSQRWARSPTFSDIEDQRSDHPDIVILKIKISLLLVPIRYSREAVVMMRDKL